MTHHRLGHKEEARATLAGLREIMKKTERTENEESQAFLREAERLMSDQPAVVEE
jgi:hypothetical protein